MRTFLGIDLPLEVRNELANVSIPDSNFKLVSKENLHITLHLLLEYFY